MNPLSILQRETCALNSKHRQQTHTHTQANNRTRCALSILLRHGAILPTPSGYCGTPVFPSRSLPHGVCMRARVCCVVLCACACSGRGTPSGKSSSKSETGRGTSTPLTRIRLCARSSAALSFTRDAESSAWQHTERCTQPVLLALRSLRACKARSHRIRQSEPQKACRVCVQMKVPAACMVTRRSHARVLARQLNGRAEWQCAVGVALRTVAEGESTAVVSSEGALGRFRKRCTALPSAGLTVPSPC
jgi:hypothetical protein